MTNRFLLPVLRHSFFSHLSPTQLLLASPPFSHRLCSNSTNATTVLKEFLATEQSGNIDDDFPPSLDQFDLVPSDSDASKLCWSRKYGDDEIVKISIKVGNVTYSPEESDFEETITNERRVHFQVLLSRPDEVDIEVNAYGSPVFRDFSLTNIAIHHKNGSSYKKNFYDFDAHVQDAFYGFIQERIGVTIALAIQENYDLVKEKLFQRWRADLKDYIDA